MSFTDPAATGTWNTSRWNNTTDGPTYASTYTANNDVNFTTGTYSIAGMGATINVGNITVNSGVTVNFTAAANTFATNGTVRTIDVGSGGTFNLAGQSISTAAGTGFNKTGTGTLIITGGGTYTGGFTLSSGAMVAGGVNAMGAGGALNLNGGILTVNSGTNRDFTGKFGGGISIGGDVQFGDSVNVSAGTGNMTFSNNMSLGAATRVLTLGYGGNVAFGGVISNTATNGLTFAGTAGGSGRFDITNTANTLTGPVLITGGEVRFSADGSLGNAANTVTVDGGRLAIVNNGTVDLSARTISLGATAGTSISAPGSSATLTYNGNLQNKSGSSGILVKQGAGTLSLGGVSTYSGDTSINNGTLLLTTGNNRLPTGTTVSLGQAASSNLGTFDLNGRNQQIAGLNSVSGTNATASENTVTSSGAATLTLGGSGNYTYSAGTQANSGIISGAITLVKSGGGTQTFGESNSYSGKTTISGGFIAGGGEGIFGTNPASFTTDQITLNGGGILSTGAIGFNSNRGITLGANGGTFDTTGGNITLTNVVAGTAGGALTKIGSGTLIADGTHTYDGATNIQNGTVQLTSGNNRLPTGTTVNLGQASSTNLGTLDLNGRNQQIAGLNSVSGTNATANKNTVTSSGSATLTLGGSGTFAYGAGTSANSGVITGAINLSKTGSGTQTLGDANTYTGSTSISGGKLVIASTGSLSNTSSISIANTSELNVNGSTNGSATVTVATGGKLSGNGTVGPVSLSGTISPGNSIGHLTTGAETWSPGGHYLWELDPASLGGGAGVSWDLLTLSTLDVSGLDSSNKFVIDITRVGGAPATQLPRYTTLTIAHGTGSAPTIDPNAFTLNDLGLGGQVWTIFEAPSGGGFDILLQTAPEPTTPLLFGSGLFGLLMARRKRGSTVAWLKLQFSAPTKVAA